MTHFEALFVHVALKLLLLQEGEFGRHRLPDLIVDLVVDGRSGLFIQRREKMVLV